MAVSAQDHSKGPTALSYLRMLILFLAIGGIGAWTGTKFFLYCDAVIHLRGKEAGVIFLLSSAVLAVPGISLLRAR